MMKNLLIINFDWTLMNKEQGGKGPHILNQFYFNLPRRIFQIKVVRWPRLHFFVFFGCILPNFVTLTPPPPLHWFPQRTPCSLMVYHTRGLISWSLRGIWLFCWEISARYTVKPNRKSEIVSAREKVTERERDRERGEQRDRGSQSVCERERERGEERRTER